MPPTTFERLLQETRDLEERLARLGQFVVSERFRHLSARQQYLLQTQQVVMSAYLQILNWRLQEVAASPTGDIA